MSNYISQDLFISILKLFPVKSLLRFRCVCKSWKELIDSQFFILAHLSLQRPQILLKNQKDKFIHLDPQSFPLFHNLTGPNWVLIEDAISSNLIEERWYNPTSVICTVHGVICLIFPRIHLLVLWNPSIRRQLLLPLPKFSNSSINYFSWGGFWIDPYTRNFKVVIFCFGRDKVTLFSSEKQTWTRVSVDPFIMKNYEASLKDPQILVDGVGHWLLCDHHTESPQRWVIISFDFCKDKFGFFKLPEPGQLDVDGYFCTFPMKWKGFVSVAYWQQQIPFRCDLWAMQNGTWYKMLSFNISPDIENLLHVVEDDYCRVLAEDEGRLMLYDSKDDSCIYLPTNAPIEGFYSVAYGFVESLIFPDVKFVLGSNLTHNWIMF